MHVMIDLETFGLGPTAAIVQIGAQCFTFEEGAVPNRMFESAVTLQSVLFTGGTVDQSTIDWWKAQDPYVQNRMSAGAEPIEGVLRNLTLWFPEDEIVEGVWSHGAAFDIPILEGAYKRLGSSPPWHYRKARDTRTLLWLAQEQGWFSDKPAPRHTALSDCEDQIFELRRAYDFLNTLIVNP